MSDCDKYDEAQYLQPSSVHGSDGEEYQVEPSQADEIARVKQRRADRRRRADESPARTPRASMREALNKTKEHFDAGGPFDSQTSSLEFTTELFHGAGLSVHTQSSSQEAPDESPVKSEPVDCPVKSEPVDQPTVEAEPRHGFIELELLRGQLEALKAVRHQEQGRYFDRLEALTEERDKYREAATKWEAAAERATQQLQLIKADIVTVVDDLEGGI
ncbi:hypothetical protein C8F04DRAFT_1240867 [Mycena alexandri]|uniref:Uncharacterized protein n=1 Tax=Mycena alexandri TaxID=1745969 RepID=A0AAD6S6X4_9AGAR|nr:hypothetical protein C8F04DRAFT_1240867 [Mycena alexandri]